jgi:hypothetical protein
MNLNKKLGLSAIAIVIVIVTLVVMNLNKKVGLSAIAIVIVTLVVLVITIVLGKENYDISLEGLEVTLPKPKVISSDPPLLLPDDSGNTDNTSKCTPCPPCARCPEPAFECKKVPTYSHVQHLENVPVQYGPYSTYGA